VGNLYSYQGVDNLDKFQLFFWVAADQAMEQLGVKDVGAALAIVAGLPLVPTRGKFGGAIRGTSVASVAARRVLDIDLKKKILPTITAGINNQGKLSIKFILHKNIGAFVGRAVPVVGWLIIAWDVGNIVVKTVTTYNSIVKSEDKIF
jgi:hypothetical protein